MKRIPCLLLPAVFSAALFGQTDWPVFHGDPGATRYTTLSDIKKGNVANLKVSWKADLGVTGGAEVTPIEIGGVMYVTSPRQVVFALDAATGREIWRYDPKLTKSSFHRGVSYWPGDKNHPPRVVAATTDARLYTLDAKTGQPVPSFGDNGVVNLRAGFADKFPDSPYGPTSPPAIYRNLAILSSQHQEGPAIGPSGAIRAFDLLTGKEAWRFHLVPQPGEPGNDTWGPDGWKDRSGPSSWAPMTVDAERHMVFVATGNPGDSFYGGDRPGTNLYANCVVALDADSGKLKWYFQIVHHDIYDFDVPAAPALIHVTHNGKKIPAVAQIAKHGLLFILDRATGKPLYDVEERPVPKSDVPGEHSWPTQPFPVKPPPLARLTVTEAELNRTTPETAAACEALFKTLKHDGPFTAYNASQKSLVFTDTGGGANWYGVSFDPTLGYIYVNINQLAAVGQLIPRKAEETIRYTAGPTRPAMPYTNDGPYTPRGGFNDPVTGRPCFQPPWGELFAINANTGEIAWEVPLGTDEAMEARGVMNTGTRTQAGSLVTSSGLLFIAGTADRQLRAFDSATGKVLWSTTTEGAVRSNPMTYKVKNGKQYLVVYSASPFGGRSGARSGAAPPATEAAARGPASASNGNVQVIAYTLP
ncbi:MAG TPA: pyrroloquinoline quinone-dependent dehydrogenase [Candidatus Acidoferrales bacterium]|jgi:glucose dehydrogenase|nr:pyrroloquinoline quinone-dependent dehydrogenase [Candidatus Acidoferrales bacterium]